VNSLAFSLVLKDDVEAPCWLERLKSAGFDGIEPTFAPEGTLPTLADPRSSAQKIRQLAESADLKIPSMRGGSLFWSTFGSPEDSQRRRAVEVARQAMEALTIMGGDTLLIVPGRWEGNQTYSELWSHALETAQQVAEIAAAHHIHIGLENVENRFLLSPHEWKEFLDAVGSKYVGMYFDVGNVVCCGLGYPEHWLREIGRERVKRLHFKDATKEGRLTYLLEGEVNWPAVAAVMRDIGYTDWVTIELTPSTFYPQVMLEGTVRAARAILSGATSNL